jgi:hypothetical protein
MPAKKRYGVPAFSAPIKIEKSRDIPAKAHQLRDYGYERQDATWKLAPDPNVTGGSATEDNPANRWSFNLGSTGKFGLITEN